MQYAVPFIDLSRHYRSIKSELISTLDSVGESGQYILGENVEAFESAIRHLVGTNYAIAVANGSDALFLTLKALGIGRGDEVITVSNSFVATVWTIVATGATPVLVDVGEDLNINQDHAISAVTPRTKGFMPVHLTGMPASMDSLIRFAKNNDLFVLEDSAQAIGASCEGKMVGSIGTAAGFSLHPLKNLSVMGDGGFITTDLHNLAEKIKLLRNHGLKTRDNCEIWGYNSRLDEIQAAFALINLKQLSSLNNRRLAIANFYSDRLRDYVEVPTVPVGKTSVFHNYIIQTNLRDSLKIFLSENGIETKIHYPIPTHKNPRLVSKLIIPAPLTQTEWLSARILSLPIFPELTDFEVELVADKVLEFFR